MHILIVEDDSHKLNQLRLFFQSHADWNGGKLEERRSFQSGLKYALLENPDLIILDMTMPNYTVEPGERGGRERRYAGEEILRRIKRRNKLIPAIIVTQFEQFGEGDEVVTLEELKSRLAANFPGQYVGAVYYQAADAQWKEDLSKLLEKVFRK